MGNYTDFYIGGKDIFHFKYSIGEEFWKIFSLIFNENEFCIGKKPLPGKYTDYIGYETSVKKAKDRLDIYHLSVQNIDISLSKLLSIRKDRLFAKNEYEPEDDDVFNSRIMFTQKAIKRSEYLDIGLYLEIRVLRKALDDAQEDNAVILDFSDMLDVIGDENEAIREVKNYWESKLKPYITLRRNYLETAKVFFTSNDYDLVFIYLTMGLEYELYNYAIRKTKKSNHLLFLRSILESEDMSLGNKIKLVNVLHKSVFDEDVIETANRVIQIRNSIVHHGGSKKYDRNQTTKAIEDVTKIVEKLKKL